jgi:hypothetical protein
MNIQGSFVNSTRMTFLERTNMCINSFRQGNLATFKYQFHDTHLLRKLVFPIGQLILFQQQEDCPGYSLKRDGYRPYWSLQTLNMQFFDNTPVFYNQMYRWFLGSITSVYIYTLYVRCIDGFSDPLLLYTFILGIIQL